MAKGLQTKIKSAAALRRLLRAKRHGRVVFTNGCFDLLHPGHVRYLERASRLGDLLVVALNSDESVRKIKGPSRPLNRLADRMEVVAALESVSYVTWFGAADPLTLILSLRPHVLVKGGDWEIDQIVGAREVLSWGGKVKSLPYHRGHSTTRLIRKSSRRTA